MILCHHDGVGTGKCLLRVHLYRETRRPPPSPQRPFYSVTLVHVPRRFTHNTVCPRAASSHSTITLHTHTPFPHDGVHSERERDKKESSSYCIRSYIPSTRVPLSCSLPRCLPPFLPSIHPSSRPPPVDRRLHLRAHNCLPRIVSSLFAPSLLRFPFSPRGRTNAQSSLSLSRQIIKRRLRRSQSTELR